MFFFPRRHVNSSPFKAAHTAIYQSAERPLYGSPLTQFAFVRSSLQNITLPTFFFFSQKSLVNNPTFCLAAYSFSKECEKCEKKNKARERDSIRSCSSLLHCCLRFMSFLHWWRGGRRKCSVLNWGMTCCHVFIGLNVNRSCDMAANALLCLTVHNSTRQRQCTIVRCPHFTILILPTVDTTNKFHAIKALSHSLPRALCEAE